MEDDHPLRILFVEDVPADAELAVRALRKEGLAFTFTRVETQAAFLKALEEFKPDVIVSDYVMPEFDGMTALKLSLERAATLPFILLTGSMNEETAVACMKAGATDYVLKDHLSRLPFAVREALEQEKARLAKEAAERARRETESRLRAVLSNAPITIFATDSQGIFTLSEGKALERVKLKPGENIGVSAIDLYGSLPFVEHTGEVITGKDFVRRALTGETVIALSELRGVYFDNHIGPLRDADGKVVGIVGVAIDITERKRAEEALRESEVGLREAQRVGHIGSWDWDAATDTIIWSAEYYRIYGFDPKLRPPGYAEHLKVYTPESAARLDAAVKHSMQTGEGYQLDLEQARADGTRRWITARGEVKRDAHGQIVGLRGTAQDITERKQAELRLRLQSTALEAAANGIVITDREGTIQWVNPAFTRLTGFTVEEAIGQNPGLLKSGKHDSAFYKNLWDTILSGKVWRGEIINRRKDGELYTEDMTITPLRATGMEITHFIAIKQDVTERKQVEEELRFRNLLLSTQQEASIDGILVVDENGKMVSFNRRFVEMWSIPAEVIESRSDERALQSVLELLVEPEEFLQKVGYLYEHRHETSREEIALRDGRTFDRYSAPMFGTDDKYYGRVWYLRDITERVQREREREAIVTMSATLRIAPTRAQMLPVLLDQLTTLSNADGTAITMRDPLSGEIVIELGSGSFARATGTRFAPGKGSIGQAMRSGQFYLNNNVQSDPEISQRDVFGDFRAIALAPLIAQARTIGALWIGRKSAIAETEIRLLTAIADIAANAIHRATLHEQTERQVGRLTALHAIDSVISASMDLRLTLNILLEHVTAQLKVDATDVLLLNPHTLTLEYAAGRGLRTRNAQTARIRLGENFAGRAALDRHSIHAGDSAQIQQSPQFAALWAGEDFADYYGVPLVIKGEIKGVLEVFHRAPIAVPPDWVDFLETLAGQIAIAIDSAQLFDNLQRANFDLTRAYDSTIEGWSCALDLRDKETEGHTQRVTEVTERLARATGIGDVELIHIRRGALLHDIGKMGVPDSILHKSDTLTAAEWVIMRQHPQLAYDMLLPIAYLRPALDIPYCHHEKWDGTGYPRGLKGEQIPLAARLFAVVDVWDALTSDRPYRAAWSRAKALEHIREQSGKHFDPRVVETFLRTIAGE